MFVQMLNLHESGFRLLVNAKDKRLHQVYKGLSKDLLNKHLIGTKIIRERCVKY